MRQIELRQLIEAEVRRITAHPDGGTSYREPLVGFSGIDDAAFAELCRSVPGHLTPERLLPGARGLVSYFLPFAENVVLANARSARVAREWATAYVETNRLLASIGERLIATLAGHGVRAVAEAPTHAFDKQRLTAKWSHKSIACMTGLGSFGLNSLVITDAGCAGRFGSLVLDIDPGILAPPPRTRCLYFHDGSCGLCVMRCPVSALSRDTSFDRQACYRRLKETGARFTDLPHTNVCGKCSVGLPCSLRDPVQGLNPGLAHTGR
ncbi:MAG: epoxyqueuosine reductase [Dehalococcoidia bacterium]|jgi:epoxyqueuosine reductase QueG|nr:epoxyqueuosine reductase [Dehalococcoidia bacterium]